MHREHFETIDSTNAAAARWAADHPDGVALFTATTQTAGRGQWGRDWQSPPGGAWFSLVMRRARPDELVSLDAAKAIRDALSGWVVASRLQVKPPNDVLLDHRKVAGILCEQSVRGGDPNHTRPVTLVVGVGVNANVDTAALQGELRRPPISLQEARGATVPIDAVIERCVQTLIARLGS
ncbi:MAG: biotin--[acetyl-CoA-carboxylase] ligase [Planctomycetota bacterium]